MPKNLSVGIVTSDKMAKTRRVEIPRLVRHPKYGKILRRKTVCHVHDESEEAHVGDTVEIRESRPRSKTKRWELVRVITKSRAVDLAAMRAALKDEEGLAGEAQSASGSAETSN
jgi:small subunit ribosomal protein S17